MTADNDDAITKCETSIIDLIGENFSILRTLWDKVGLSNEERNVELLKTLVEIQEAIGRLVTGAENQEKTLREETDKDYAELAKIAQELASDCPELDPNLSLNDRKKELENGILDLLKEKENRMLQQDSLDKEHAQLAVKLGVPRPVQSKGSVPSKEALETLRTEVESKRALLSERRELYHQVKREAIRIIEKIEIPRSDLQGFQQKVVYDDESQMIFSFETMSKLAEFGRYLVATYEGFRANIKDYIDKARDEIEDLWEQCCVSIGEKNNCDVMRATTFSEELLEDHRAEIRRLKKRQEHLKPVLDKLILWTNTFNEMITCEEKANDPNRFSNRGGALLQEEKKRKRVERELPKVRKDLIEEARNWENANNQQCLVYGTAVAAHVAEVEETYEQRKIEEKSGNARRKTRIENGAEKEKKTPGSPRKQSTSPAETPVGGRTFGRKSIIKSSEKSA